MKKLHISYSNTWVTATISAVGASLTTAVALSDHHGTAFIVESILLAGVTALGVGLAGVATGNNEDKGNE